MAIQAVSIRSVTVGLVVACIVVVGTVCTLLSIVSSDRALDDTKKSRDASVEGAFEAGSTTVLDVTDKFLNELGDGGVRHLASFWGVAQNAVDAHCRILSAADPVEQQSWEFIYSQRSLMYNQLLTYPQLDGISLNTIKWQSFTVTENIHTMKNPKDGYHHIHGVLNNGTDYDIPGIPNINRTLVGDISLDGSGDLFGFPDNTSNGHRTDCVGELGMMTEGKYLESPCEYGNGDIVKDNLMLFGATPMGTVYNTPLVPVGPYVSVLTACDWGNHAGGYALGTIVAGSDLRGVSEFLENLDLGSPKARMFIVIKGNWAVPGYQAGVLAGTSHGSAFFVSNSEQAGTFWYRAPQSATKCSDMYVAGTAVHLEGIIEVNGTNTSRYEDQVTRTTPGNFYMPTTNETNATEEEFYVSVKPFTLGPVTVDWYVVTVIDRYAVLGKVDAINLATRAGIKESEDSVNDDLKKARTVLYIVVTFCVVIPILLTIALVFRITQPLINLMTDMSYVATMNLEQVDHHRPLSVLAEVKEMEKSFKKMIENLTEYRQYLPQSLLVDTASEVEEDIKTITERKSASAYDKKSVRSSDVTPSVATLNRTNVFDATTASKSVTLMMTNIEGMHTLLEFSKGPVDLITSYLEPIVQLARKKRGIVDEFSGDRVLVSFNTSMPSASHKNHAVDLGYLLQAQFKDKIKVNMAFASGHAVVGNMGCVGFKKYTIIGNVACTVRMLERAGREWGVPMLCDGNVATDAAFHYVLQKMVKVLLKNDKETLVHKIVISKEADNEEWMYQLEQSTTSDPYRKLNAAVVSLYDGDADAAKLLLENCSLDGADLVRALIAHTLHTGSPPAPINIFKIKSPFPEAL